MGQPDFHNFFWKNKYFLSENFKDDQKGLISKETENNFLLKVPAKKLINNPFSLLLTAL